MANKDAAFGLRPVRMMGGAPYSGGQSRYRIASGLSGKIFQGDLVKQVTGGGIERAAASSTVPVVGVFNGCQYTDPTSPVSRFFLTTTPVQIAACRHHCFHHRRSHDRLCCSSGCSFPSSRLVWQF